MGSSGNGHGSNSTQGCSGWDCWDVCAGAGMDDAGGSFQPRIFHDSLILCKIRILLGSFSIWTCPSLMASTWKALVGALAANPPWNSLCATANPSGNTSVPCAPRTLLGNPATSQVTAWQRHFRGSSKLGWEGLIPSFFHFCGNG